MSACEEKCEEVAASFLERYGTTRSRITYFPVKYLDDLIDTSYGWYINIRTRFINLYFYDIFLLYNFIWRAIFNIRLKLECYHLNVVTKITNVMFRVEGCFLPFLSLAISCIAAEVCVSFAIYGFWAEEAEDAGMTNGSLKRILRFFKLSITEIYVFKKSHIEKERRIQICFIFGKDV